MRMYSGVFTVFLGIIFPAALSASDIFMCRAEHSTGFTINADGKTWKSTNFIADDTYLIKPTSEVIEILGSEVAYAYEITEFGNEYPTYSCNDGFTYTYLDTTLPSSSLKCSGVGQFYFSKDTFRYIVTYPFGWIDSKASEIQKEGNTPHIELGSCVKM